MDLTNSLLAGCCVTSFIAAIFALMAYLGGRRTEDDLTVAKATHLIRAETEIIRGSMENHSRGLRQELVQLVGTFQDAVFAGFSGLRTGIETQVTEFGGRLDSGILLIDQKTNGISNKLNTDMERMRSEAVTNRDNLRTLVENKLDQNLAGHTETAKALKDELGDNFHRLGTRVNDSLGESSKAQSDRLESATAAITSLSEKLEKAQEGLRVTVEGKLETIRTDNEAKLEQMRATVEEKLHDTLEQRLTTSFKVVSDQLEQVFRGLGEMQTLAAGVGDLKRMMTNVKARGTWGEVTLGSILEHAMAPDQYDKNVEVQPGSGQRVEYAIKLPGGDDGPLWLPIDAKFPTEDYERLVDASNRGDVEATEVSAKAVETRIRHSASEICAKYVHPPFSTDFAILFLPTEGLYAEIIRRPGVVDSIQRDSRIIITGPTTLLALLNSLRMGFRTLAIQKRSSEVWKTLGEVKAEFGKYGTIIEKVQKKLQEASTTIDEVAKRRRAMDRKLRSVEILPEMEANALLEVAHLDVPEPAEADDPSED